MRLIQFKLRCPQHIIMSKAHPYMMQNKFLIIWKVQLPKMSEQYLKLLITLIFKRFWLTMINCLLIHLQINLLLQYHQVWTKMLGIVLQKVKIYYLKLFKMMIQSISKLMKVFVIFKKRNIIETDKSYQFRMSQVIGNQIYSWNEQIFYFLL